MREVPPSLQGVEVVPVSVNLAKAVPGQAAVRLVATPQAVAVRVALPPLLLALLAHKQHQVLELEEVEEVLQPPLHLLAVPVVLVAVVVAVVGPQ